MKSSTSTSSPSPVALPAAPTVVTDAVSALLNDEAARNDAVRNVEGASALSRRIGALILRRAAERLGSPPYGDGGTAQCAQALGILVEILSRKGADDAEKQQAAELCDTLATLDAIRVAYWNWRKTQVLDPLY